MGHWDTWEDGALIMDKQTRPLRGRDKVHRLDHVGKFFKSRGPFTVPRSQQGHPVLIQAGQSGRGRAFASRWAELVFVVYPNLAHGKKQYAELKEALAEAGRDPDAVKIAPACKMIVAETDEIAREAARIYRQPGEADRFSGIALRSAQHRFRQARLRRAVQRCRKWPRCPAGPDFATAW